MKQMHRASAIPYYGVAVLWVLYALFLPLYQLWHFLFPIALSVPVFILLKKLFPGKDYTVELPEPEPDTGNATLDEAIRQGRDGIAQLRALNQKIEDPRITWQLDQMETITGKIFDQVRAHPELLPQIRKFMSYYLPTTLKLLESYHELDSSGAGGGEVEQAKARISGMMDTVLKAFQHQLDALFTARTMDINAEVEVLETMMEAEGLKDMKNNGLYL